DPIEDFKKINSELSQYSSGFIKKPQIAAANKMDLIQGDDESYRRFKEFAEGEGYEVVPLSAATGKGIKELMARALEILRETEEEPLEEEYELFDFSADERDPDYRTVKVEFDGKNYILSGKQLEKIFDSTNFNDSGSLRYLYRYIENSGAIEELKNMGIGDGDIIKIKDFEFEYFDEDY
ncbi:MAG TPA: Obg family GTPase CgtA, partial [Candidatus Copromorpha excrementigallinarum]|nr:Obg family GTPase CgtA [Candidatus Copromorpha excrementigallinarum]